MTTQLVLEREEKDRSLVAKPFLKWAGSKKWLIPSIRKYLPSNFNKYYEPFLGSGALFFELRPAIAQLSDFNEDLINTYIALRDYPEAIIKKLRTMPYRERFYYWVRDEFRPRSEISKAAQLIYLNRTCWNGLYRVNRSGKFNVPFGRHANPTICDESNLRAVAKALQNVELCVSNFEEAVEGAKKGDFIFFDPPYITGHSNNGFHFYNSKLFSWADQEKLAEIAEGLNERGCFVLITNADNKSIASLYKKFRRYPISRHSGIAADVLNRGVVTELIITNYTSKLL